MRSVAGAEVQHMTDLSEAEAQLLERLWRLSGHYPGRLIPSRAAAGLLGIGDLVDKGYVRHIRSNGANGPVHHYFRPAAPG